MYKYEETSFFYADGMEEDLVDDADIEYYEEELTGTLLEDENTSWGWI